MAARLLPLRNGRHTTVDAGDFEWLSSGAWSCNREGRVYGSIFVDGHRRSTAISRLIMDAPKGLLVDHIDGNPLNNQRSNLRLCTAAQNSWNRGRHSTSASAYKGVGRLKSGRYRACIRCHGRIYRLGHFDDAAAAARAYDRAAIRLHGEFARLNFPNDRYEEPASPWWRIATQQRHGSQEAAL